MIDYDWLCLTMIAIRIINHSYWSQCSQTNRVDSWTVPRCQVCTRALQPSGISPGCRKGGGAWCRGNHHPKYAWNIWFISGKWTKLQTGKALSKFQWHISYLIAVYSGLLLHPPKVRFFSNFSINPSQLPDLGFPWRPLWYQNCSWFNHWILRHPYNSRISRHFMILSPPLWHYHPHQYV